MGAFGHICHIVMCFLTGFVWLVVYIPCILIFANNTNKRAEKQRKEELELLKEIRDQGKFKDYRK